MKIQLISDTHNHLEITADPAADFLVIAGDICNGYLDRLLPLKQLPIPYVLVLGNHDFYGHNMADVYDFLDDHAINYLTTGKVYQYQHITFVGDTLFSNFELYGTANIADATLLAQQYINDFRHILYQKRLVQATDYISFYKKAMAWIEQFRHQPNVVVVTHFVPHKIGLDPYYESHPSYKGLNPYFVNNINVAGFKNWLCGHTHTCFDKTVDDCRIICNAYGYTHEQGKNGFKTTIIEV